MFPQWQKERTTSILWSRLHCPYEIYINAAADRLVETYDTAAYIASATNREIDGIQQPLPLCDAKKIIADRPDWISLVNYLHSAEKFRPQRNISAVDLPSAKLRPERVQQAINRLSTLDYVPHKDQLFFPKAVMNQQLRYNKGGCFTITRVTRRVTRLTWTATWLNWEWLSLEVSIQHTVKINGIYITRQTGTE